MHNEFLSRSGRGAQSHPGLAVVGLIFEELRLRSRAAGPRCGAAALGPLAPKAAQASALLLPVRRALPAGLTVQTLQGNVVPYRRQDAFLLTRVRISSRKQQLAPKVKAQVVMTAGGLF
jgi:hypothetical protein